MTSSGYALTTSYNIISIKYRSGGVSSGGNPIIQKDMELFNTTDRWVKANNYGWYHKRILEYTVRKYLKKRLTMRILYKLVYFDVVISRIIYKFSEFCAGKDDYDQLLNSNTKWG